jgi:hypothetical protein
MPPRTPASVPAELSAVDAERLLGVKAGTIRQWAKRGKLAAAGSIPASRAGIPDPVRTVPVYRTSDIAALAGLDVTVRQDHRPRRPCDDDLDDRPEPSPRTRAQQRQRSRESWVDRYTSWINAGRGPRCRYCHDRVRAGQQWGLLLDRCVVHLPGGCRGGYVPPGPSQVLTVEQYLDPRNWSFGRRVIEETDDDWISVSPAWALAEAGHGWRVV